MVEGLVSVKSWAPPSDSSLVSADRKRKEPSPDIAPVVYPDPAQVVDSNQTPVAPLLMSAPVVPTLSSVAPHSACHMLTESSSAADVPDLSFRQRIAAAAMMASRAGLPPPATIRGAPSLFSSSEHAAPTPGSSFGTAAPPLGPSFATAAPPLGSSEAVSSSFADDGVASRLGPPLRGRGSRGSRGSRGQGATRGLTRGAGKHGNRRGRPPKYVSREHSRFVVSAGYYRNRVAQLWERYRKAVENKEETEAQKLLVKIQTADQNAKERENRANLEAQKAPSDTLLHTVTEPSQSSSVDPSLQHSFLTGAAASLPAASRGGPSALEAAVLAAAAVAPGVGVPMPVTKLASPAGRVLFFFLVFVSHPWVSRGHGFFTGFSPVTFAKVAAAAALAGAAAAASFSFPVTPFPTEAKRKNKDM